MVPCPEEYMRAWRREIWGRHYIQQRSDLRYSGRTGGASAIPSARCSSPARR